MALVIRKKGKSELEPIFGPRTPTTVIVERIRTIPERRAARAAEGMAFRGVVRVGTRTPRTRFWLPNAAGVSALEKTGPKPRLRTGWRLIKSKPLRAPSRLAAMKNI